MADLEDRVLLEACAAEARRSSRSLCETEPATGENCAWYHGFWPTLRLLNLVTTPNTHGAFYTRTLGALARDGHKRVLISGSADISMLQRIYAAFDAADATPEITFVDRCPTPVALAEWYAERTGRNIETQCCDILEFTGVRFDIVCTHSFMGYFNDEARQRLARKWANALMPGGKVVTINRVRPNASGVVTFTPAQKRKFVEHARTMAIQRGLDAPEIADAAATYAKKFRIRPVTSRSALDRFFTDNGFRVDRMETEPVADAEAPEETGPTTPGGATYVQMVATRI